MENRLKNRSGNYIFQIIRQIIRQIRNKFHFMTYFKENKNVLFEYFFVEHSKHRIGIFRCLGIFFRKIWCHSILFWNLLECSKLIQKCY